MGDDFMNEIWKNIKGFNDFEVSNLGRVRNARLGLVKSQRSTPTGYKIVDLKENGQRHTRYVHRLVAEAFIENLSDHPQVNHKDENKENNHSGNLEWCSVAYNNSYNERAKRVGQHHKNNHPGRKQVICICTGIAYASLNEAARQTGVNRMSIAYALNGKQKTAGGYRWEVVA